jgi:HD-GYP domain-containing protein (c-di-GMP phosphodiesterase class II)
VLVVPLKNHNSEVIGVLQLINRKRRREIILRDPEIVEREVIGFDDELVDLAATLASQAAVALDNNLLLREIESLFEAFVVASSSAIEDRDPSTSGHSQRVTLLTIELARAINETREGPLKDVHFNPAQLKELRYATLLHDFGKIGVREAVLTKSHKIEPHHFEAIKNRVLALRRQREAVGNRRKVEFLLDDSLPRHRALELVEEIDRALCVELEQLDSDLELLQTTNNPEVVRITDEEWKQHEIMLGRLKCLSYIDERGQTKPILTPEECHALEVRRGSLTPEEFEQIKEHAQLSYEFLERIPWTRNFENIPPIAHAHHERNDGSGYPRGLSEQEIPIGSRIMAIADVFDALTAADRPYKRAMDPKRALEILRQDADAGKLDPDMLDIFIKRNIYKLTADWVPGTA